MFSTKSRYITTADNHKKITKPLEDNDYQFYCRSMDVEPQMKAVLKFVHAFITTEQIQYTLKVEGQTVNNVSMITRRTENGTSIPITIVLVQMLVTEKNKEIFNRMQPMQMLEIFDNDALQCCNCIGLHTASFRQSPKYSQRTKTSKQIAPPMLRTHYSALRTTDTKYVHARNSQQRPSP